MPDAAGDAGPATGPPPRRDALLFAAVTAAALAPLVAAVVSVAGAPWHPVGDHAIEMLRIGEVGTRHTPLVGVYSRFGWDHPGPLAFHVLAPFRWLLGDGGVLLGVGVLNAVAIGGAVAVARRRGGNALAATVAAVALALVAGLGTDLLVDPWNPWLAVLPFWCCVLLAWAVLEGDTAALPWLVLAGSFAVQAHAGYAPLVAGLGVLAAATAVIAHRRTPGSARHAGIAAAVGLVCWALPLWDQAFGSGNLGAILEAARDPRDPALGWEFAHGVFGVQLGPRLPWVTGDDVSVLGTAATGSTWFATGVVGAVVVLGALAAARGARAAGRFAAVAVASVGLALFATSRISGLTGPYVVRSWWVVAAACWCSIAWSAWCLAARPPRVRRVAAAGAGALVAIVAVVLAAAAVPASVPERELSDQVGVLATATAPHLERDGRYRVAWVDRRHLGAAGVGVFHALRERGFDVRVDEEFAGSIGERFATGDEDVDGTVYVVVRDALEAGWRPPPGARQVATAEPLTPAELARMAALDRAIRAEVAGLDLPAGPLPVDLPVGRATLVEHGADPDHVRELHELRAPVSGHTVYLVPAPGGAD
ncbi:MAG: hypothetical protein KatS3mg009_2046 [Acidimicrobiia bacterium]|nr:MAG: hypothetical protein KatS3mg009_2046 [Acidimicrobiia bacterium]